MQKTVAALLCLSLLLASQGCVVAQRDVDHTHEPVPVTVAGPGSCSDGLPTPLTWLIADFHIDNITMPQTLPDSDFNSLLETASDTLGRSLAQFVGGSLRFGFLSDIIMLEPIEVQAIVLLQNRPNATVISQIEDWADNVAPGISPELQSVNNSASLDAAAAAYNIPHSDYSLPEQYAGAVLVLDNITITNCVPDEFSDLIVTVENLLRSQEGVVNASCMPTPELYMVTNFALSDILAIPRADALGGLGLVPDVQLALLANTSADDYTPVAVNISAITNDTVTSLLMDAQRTVASTLMHFLTSPVGPMWEGGGAGAFALPLNRSRVDNSTVWLARQALREPVSTRAGNVSARAALTGLSIQGCLGGYFFSDNPISSIELYNEEGCPINADGSLPTPFFTSTPLWFAQLNATMEGLPEGASMAQTAPAVQDVTDKMLWTLGSLILGSSLSGLRNTTFVWPSNVVDGEMLVSAQIALPSVPDQETLDFAITAVSQDDAGSGLQFPWGSAYFSNISFTPCIPLWFQMGNGLANEASIHNSINANASAPAPAPAPASDSSAPVGAIVGGVVGGVALVALLAAGFLWRRRRQRAVAAVSMSSAHLRGSAGMDDSWLIPYADIRMLEPLGEGAFGTVYTAKWKDTAVAVKALHAMQASNASSDNASGTVALHNSEPSSVQSMQKEAAIMSAIRHPNCIMYLGAVLDPPCLVMELASKGSLLEVLHKAKDPVPWVRRVNMAFDAAKGMQYLHSRQPAIIHRDLKSPNLLVCGHWQVKVSDFGLSRAVQEQQGNILSSVGGPGNPRWLAPEVLAGDPFIAPSDVYAYGIILWELLCQGSLPWEGLGAWKIVSIVRAGERPPVPPPEQCPGFAAYDRWVQLMTDCWQQDPAARPTFDDICARLRGMLGMVMKARRGTPAKVGELDKPPSLTQRIKNAFVHGDTAEVERRPSGEAV